jgi:hypothetical protein
MSKIRSKQLKREQLVTLDADEANINWTVTSEIDKIPDTFQQFKSLVSRRRVR